jgi:hypothetical protein
LHDHFIAKILVSLSLAFEKYGSSVGHMLTWNFGKKTGLTPYDIANRPDEFVSCIYEIFGAGAKSIEDTIVKEICQEFGIDPTSVSGLVDTLHSASAMMPRENLLEEEQCF